MTEERNTETSENDAKTVEPAVDAVEAGQVLEEEKTDYKPRKSFVTQNAEDRRLPSKHLTFRLKTQAFEQTMQIIKDDYSGDKSKFMRELVRDRLMWAKRREKFVDELVAQMVEYGVTLHDLSKRGAPLDDASAQK